MHTKVAAGPIFEVSPFALCAIRVDHDVAWWGRDLPSQRSSISFTVLTAQDEPTQNVGSLSVTRASSWCILVTSRDHAFLAAISCLLFRASLKDLNFQTISPALQLIFHCRTCFATASIVIVTVVARSRPDCVQQSPNYSIFVSTLRADLTAECLVGRTSLQSYWISLTWLYNSLLHHRYPASDK